MVIGKAVSPSRLGEHRGLDVIMRAGIRAMCVGTGPVRAGVCPRSTILGAVGGRLRSPDWRAYFTSTTRGEGRGMQNSGTAETQRTQRRTYALLFSAFSAVSLCSRVRRGCVETLLRVIHRRLYRAGAGSGLIYLTLATRGKGTELQRVAVVCVCARNIALRSSFALLADLCGDNLCATIPNRATRR